MGFISVAFKSISFHPHYSSLVLNASLKAGIYSVAMFHKNNHTVRCGYFYGYRERFYMLRRNKVALRQGFGLRPKRLYGAKAPPARRLLQRNAESFSYAYAKLKATFWSCTAGLKCSLFFYKTSIILAFTQCYGGFVMFK